MASAGSATSLGSDRSIDARSIVTLIVFFVVNALVIFPLSIPLPLSLSRRLSRFFRPKDVAAQEAANASHGNTPADSDETTVTAITLTQDPSASQSESAPNGNGHVVAKAQGAASEPTTTRSDPQQSKRLHFVLGLETAPVVGVLLLLAFTCIDGEVLRDGIVGRGGVRPYDIMTLFLAFAYIAISLDRTNLLRYLAFQVASRSASSGRQLYLSFFSFFSLLGLIVGNDPLILSGTPFLAHFSRLASIPDSTAYLFTQFQTANLVSALLVSSNPTNLVLTSAFHISFLSYSAWLALPTIAALLVLFPVLRWWVFRKEGMIPRKLTPPPAHDPANALHDPWGAVIGGCLFLVTIIVLIALSAVGKLEGTEGVWTVTAPAAVLILLRDAAYDLLRHKDQRKEGVKETSEKARQEEGNDGIVQPVTEKNASWPPSSVAEKKISRPASPAPKSLASPVAAGDSTSAMETTSAATASGDDHEAETPLQSSSNRSTPTLSPAKQTSPPLPASTPPSPARETAPLIRRPSTNWLTRTLPTVSDIILHLPLTLIPFAFAMFMLVESLEYTGWIRVWGGWWAAWADVGGVAGCVAIMGIISVIGCNIFGTNIGATVLLSRVLQQWVAQRPSVSPRALYGSVFALAVGSNFGAYSFVFPASLAGLLWRHLLKQKDMVVTRKQFARWNWVSLVVTLSVGCLVVAGEVCVMYAW